MSKVYLVDDDSAVRTSLAFFLRAAGFTVHPFGAGQEFIASVGRLDPGCVMLDLRMPGMDGFEVIAALAGFRSKLPVIVMTGHGDVAIAVRAMKAGAIDFLEKPFEESVLIDILARVFASQADRLRDHDRQAEAAALLASLTDRERLVLVGLISGRANKVLAYDLGISIRTVEMHRASMMNRLGVRTFADALRIAFEGRIDLGDGAQSHLAA